MTGYSLIKKTDIYVANIHYIFVQNTLYFTMVFLLYTDKYQWNQAQHRGIEIINTKFDKEQLTPLLFKCIDEVFSNLEQHRNNNFTGKMLMHHSLQSSKYMSKWIQEKNRKNRL